MRPKQEELDQAAPRRKGEENLWECPFCGKNDFPELTEVRLFLTGSVLRNFLLVPSIILLSGKRVPVLAIHKSREPGSGNIE
jgi:hypothetical protein